MYNRYIKKYNFWKRMIRCISILVCVVFYFSGYKIMITFISESGPLLTVVSSVWLLICFLLSLFVFHVMFHFNLKQIDSILMNNCDSKLYSNVMRKIYIRESSKTIHSVLLPYYIDGLRINGDYDVLKQVIKKNEKDLKNDLAMLIAKLEMAEGKEFEEHYKALVNRFESILQKLNKHPNMAKEKIARCYSNMEHYKAYNLQHYNKYQEALTIYKSEDKYFIYKIEKVIHNYNIGYCLFKLNKYEEAKSYFDEVIREGNTLYVVSKAKEHNEIINQSIGCKGEVEKKLENEKE